MPSAKRNLDFVLLLLTVDSLSCRCRGDIKMHFFSTKSLLLTVYRTLYGLRIEKVTSGSFSLLLTEDKVPRFDMKSQL